MTKLNPDLYKKLREFMQSEIFTSLIVQDLINGEPPSASGLSSLLKNNAPNKHFYAGKKSNEFNFSILSFDVDLDRYLESSVFLKTF